MGVLIIPGLGDSGPDHWQTWWESREPTRRVRQEDWNRPQLETWALQVQKELDAAAGPFWLVCHSFGCLAAVAAGVARPERVAGVLFVAPADPDRFGARAALPAVRLPFPSLIVASLDDPWLSFGEAAAWAERWGSRLVSLGRAGHINAASGFGPWPEGRRLMAEMQGETPLASAGRCRPA